VIPGYALPISSGSRMRSNSLVIVRGGHTATLLAGTLQLHHAFGLFLYEFDGTGQAVPSVRPAQDIGSVPDPTAPPRRDAHQMPGHAWGWILAPDLAQPGRPAPATIWIIGPIGMNRDFASRRSHSTVEVEVMCSHRVQLCALILHLSAHD
jgi:hypothetical protein